MKRHGEHPLKKLARAMGVAARNIETPIYRKMAARDAADIPVTLPERAPNHRATMARLGRRLMARLPDLQPDEFVEAARELRACAGAVDSDFRVISEVKLGDKRRGTTG